MSDDHPPIQLPLITALPDRGLAATKSSHRWARPPGNQDPLNLTIAWPRAGRWGIPALEPCQFIPAELAAWHDPGARRRAAGTGALHFFLDDYRFERVWTRPADVLARLHEVGAALTPDFSVWCDMPLAVQLWQVYRSRWCGAWWQYHGITVIPTVSWGTQESWAFAFEGLPEHSCLAVGAVGINNPDSRDLFRAGLAELLARTAPAALLVYGHLPPQCDDLDLPTVYEFPTFWEMRAMRGPAPTNAGPERE
ncbi:DUF4417 domain-containing protein [Nocardia sp. NPDC057030]|uniref:DUF4417 domain-containing protein n=1 Tax=unclassified Nocardia TaxID=2637762 RepID=UPI0036435E05